MTATEMATELGERIKHEGEKLRALELVTLPVRKKRKSRGKLKTATLLALCGGVGFAIFRAWRNRAAPSAMTADTTMRRGNGTAPEAARDEPLATASS